PAVPDVKGEWVYAHTSPVYVVVAGKPAGAAEDARYFLAWIDRLWDTVQERDRMPDKRSWNEVQAEVDAARKVYQGMIGRGEGREEAVQSGGGRAVEERVQPWRVPFVWRRSATHPRPTTTTGSASTSGRSARSFCGWRRTGPTSSASPRSAPVPARSPR